MGSPGPALNSLAARRSHSSRGAGAHDPAYYGASAQMWSWYSRLQDSNIIGYGSVATTSDPQGDRTFAKWVATAIER
jgi:hypothetical protein